MASACGRRCFRRSKVVGNGLFLRCIAMDFARPTAVLAAPKKTLATAATAMRLVPAQQVTVWLGIWGLAATAVPVGWWAWVARSLPQGSEAGGDGGGSAGHRAGFCRKWFAVGPQWLPEHFCGECGFAADGGTARVSHCSCGWHHTGLTWVRLLRSISGRRMPIVLALHLLYANRF